MYDEVLTLIKLDLIQVKKWNADIISYMLKSLVCLQQGNANKSKKLIKMANIEE